AGGGVGEGFDTQNGSAAVVIGGNSNVQYTTIRRCRLHDSARTTADTGYGIETEGGDHIVIEKSTLGPGIGNKAVLARHTNFGALTSNYIVGAADHALVLTSDQW